MQPRSLALVVLGGWALAVGGLLACSDFEDAGAVPGADERDGSAVDAAPDVPAVDGATPDAGAESAYRAAVIADGPLVYWRMGVLGAATAITDEMQSGNVLYLQGGGHELVPGALVRDGDDNRAIRFDGRTAYARAADAAAFDFAEGAPFTLECWARREALDGGDYFQSLLGKIDGFNASARGYTLYVAPDDSADETGGTLGSGDAAIGVFGRVVPTDAWAHYALVFDGSSLRLYIDGTQEQALATSMTMPPRPGDFIVGRDPRTDNSFWPGAIDEIAIYAKALSLDDVARHAALGKL